MPMSAEGQWTISSKLLSGMSARHCLLHGCCFGGLCWASTQADGVDEKQLFPVVQRKEVLACQKTYVCVHIKWHTHGACLNLTIQKCYIFSYIVFCLPSSIPRTSTIDFYSSNQKDFYSSKYYPSLFPCYRPYSCQVLDSVKEKK